jgi:hypothetical protein
VNEEFARVREFCDRYDDEGQCRVKACLELTLWHYGMRQDAAAVLDFYRRSLELVRPHVTFFCASRKFILKPIKTSTFEVLPHWLSPETAEQDVYLFRLESGRTAKEASDRAFDLYEFIFPGYVRLVLPLEYLTEVGAAAFAALAKSLAGQMRFISGWGGYSMNALMDYRPPAYYSAVYAISRRFRGMQVGMAGDCGRYSRQSLTRVNWLTFVGNEFLARIGGRDRLRPQLGEAITVHDLPHGVMVQAGPEPRFGDVNRQEDLSHYHQVGRALRELAIPERDLGRDNSIGDDEENTRDWLYRFFR